MFDLYELQATIKALKSQALIEDYFKVNEDPIDIPHGVIVPLLDPFCIEGPSVFEFSIQASFVDEVKSIMVTLMVDNTIVAQSQVNDEQAPSSLSLIYRAKMENEHNQIMLVVTSQDDNAENIPRIEEKHLQVGYKLYGPGYNLIDTLDTSCIATPDEP